MTVSKYAQKVLDRQKPLADTSFIKNKDKESSKDSKLKNRITHWDSDMAQDEPVIKENIYQKLKRILDDDDVQMLKDFYQKHPLSKKTENFPALTNKKITVPVQNVNYERKIYCLQNDRSECFKFLFSQSTVEDNSYFFYTYLVQASYHNSIGCLDFILPQVSNQDLLDLTQIKINEDYQRKIYTKTLSFPPEKEKNILNIIPKEARSLIENEMEKR